MTTDTDPTRAALDAFTEYVVANYPPGTIISDPAWHAPRLFRIAQRHLRAALAQPAGASAQQAEPALPAGMSSPLQPAFGYRHARAALASAQPSAGGGEPVGWFVSEVGDSDVNFWTEKPDDEQIEIMEKQCGAKIAVRRALAATPSEPTPAAAGSAEARFLWINIRALRSTLDPDPCSPFFEIPFAYREKQASDDVRVLLMDATPPTQTPAPTAEPDGWQLAPKIATSEMKEAALEASRAEGDVAPGAGPALPVGYELWSAGFIYRAMLAAAPTAKAQEPAQAVRLTEEEIEALADSPQPYSRAIETAVLRKNGLEVAP